MKKLLTTVITLIFMGCVFAFGANKSVSEMTAQEIVDDMQIGWNLGNSLDAHGCGYQYSVTDPGEAERFWGNPETSEALIKAVKNAGFKTVRIPTTWYEKCDSSYNIDPKWMARVKQVVDMCLQNDMYVILNTHHEEGTGGHTGWLIPDNAHLEGNKTVVQKLWTQIATQFKDYDKHLIFETINEPRMIGSDDEWTDGTEETIRCISEINKAAVSAIRATGGNNAKRLIMCPANAAKYTSAMSSAFSLPDDDNIALSVHHYAPYEFAAKPDGTSTWGSESDKNTLKGEIATMYTNFTAKGIPVIIGEMGATYRGDASNPTENDSRALWAEYFTKTARSYGITCVVWDNNVITVGNNGTAERFMLIDRQTNKVVFPDLVKALVKGGTGNAQSQPVPEVPSLDSKRYAIETLKEGTSNKVGAWTTIPDYKFTTNGSEISLNNTVKGELSAETDMIAITYDCASAPYLCFNDNDAGDKNWNQFKPDLVDGNTAYYYYSTFKNCNTPLSSQDEIMVMGEGELSISGMYLLHIRDINKDSEVTTIDTTEALKAVTTYKALSENNNKLADFNNDGKVDLTDIIKFFEII